MRRTVVSLPLLGWMCLPAFCGPLVCTSDNTIISFDVTFGADRETSVFIADLKSGRTIHTFNNQHGGHGGLAWNTGPDEIRIRVNSATCFRIDAFSRIGEHLWRPLPYETWDYTVGFEDAHDWDMNDAQVVYSIVPAFRPRPMMQGGGVIPYAGPAPDYRIP